MPSKKIYATLKVYIFLLQDMSLDAPIQIDLSQDNGWDSLDDSQLSSQEKELLAQQFSEETQGIIYFTQQELQDFKDILKSELPEIVSAELQDFTQEQMLEWLSSSDILSENEVLSSENMDKLDAQSQVILFSEWGVFEGMNISPVAQDHMSVALSLSIIQQISSNPDISVEDILSMLSGENEELIWKLEEKILGLRELVSWIVNQEDDMHANSLDIAGNGERNYLFMQTEKWVEFFNSLFSEELKPNDIESKIESENIDESETMPEWIVNNLSWFQITANDNISDISRSVQNAVLNAPPEQVRNIREQLQEDSSGEELTGIAKFIHDLLKGIFDAISSISSENSDWDSVENPEISSLVESSQEQNPDLSSQLQEIRIPNFDLWPLLSNPDNIIQIQSILEDLDPRTTAQQEFEWLFWADNRFSQISTIFQNNNEAFPNDLSHADRFMTILKTYNTYRNDPDVAGKTDDRPTWHAWSQQHDWTQN